MIRTPQQYIESLNDGRVAYFLGERIHDVTKQPLLRGSIDRASLDWVMANDSRYQEFVTELDKDGDRVHFLWKQPETAEDLIRQRDIYVTSCRIGFGIGQNPHAMGVHALLAAGVVAARMDKKIGTQYMDAVENYDHRPPVILSSGCDQAGAGIFGVARFNPVHAVINQH